VPWYEIYVDEDHLHLESHSICSEKVHFKLLRQCSIYNSLFYIT
jgi:hypothetical protein